MTVLDTVHASTSDPAVDAVFGENTAQGARGRGLHGRSPDGAGVFGESTNFIGVAVLGLVYPATMMPPAVSVFMARALSPGLLQEARMAMGTV